MQSKTRQFDILQTGSDQMGFSRHDVEKTRAKSRKYVSFLEGAEKYSIGITKFRALAKRANAVQKINSSMLVNCELFEKYLEAYRNI